MRKIVLGSRISFGDFVLLPEAGQLYRRGVLIKSARPLEIALLALLVERAGEKVTNAEIMQRLWPDQIPPKNRLNVVMSTLRSRLTDTNSKQRKYISTLADGYCFVHTVDRIERSGNAANHAEAEHAVRAGMRRLDSRREPSLRESVAHFQQAIDSDSSHVQAWVGLATAQIMMAIHCAEFPEDAFGKARAAAEEALRIDPANLDAETIVAWVQLCFERDWIAARAAFDQNLKRKPDSFFAHNGMSLLQLAMGNSQENLNSMVRAIRLNPLSSALRSLLAHSYYTARRYEKAIEMGRRALASDPASCIAHVVLALSQLKLNDTQEALQHLNLARQHSGESRVYIGFWGYGHALAGLPSEAEEALDRLLSLPSHEYIPSYFVGLIHLGLERAKEAIEWLERACDERSHWVLFLNSDPAFDALRGESRFNSLLDRVGLTKAAIEARADSALTRKLR